MDIGDEIRVIQVEAEKIFAEPLLLEEIESEWPPEAPVRSVGDGEEDEEG